MDEGAPTNDADGVSIHSGFPNPAADTSLHGLDLNKLLIQHAPSTFLFRIRGNEWQDSGIFDGDVALVDRALDPHANDIVLWWDEGRGEFALSRHHRMPADAACRGVVTATIHQLRKLLP